MLKDSLWEFVVNNRKGGRMFLVHDGCTHGELLEMAQEDYDLDKKIEIMVLTYSLPDVILQQLTPNTQILLLCLSQMIDKYGTWSSYLRHTLYAFMYQASAKYTRNFWIDYMLDNKCRLLCKSTNVDCS